MIMYRHGSKNFDLSVRRPLPHSDLTGRASPVKTTPGDLKGYGPGLAVAAKLPPILQRLQRLCALYKHNAIAAGRHHQEFRTDSLSGS